MPERHETFFSNTSFLRNLRGTPLKERSTSQLPEQPMPPNTDTPKAKAMPSHGVSTLPRHGQVRRRGMWQKVGNFNAGDDSLGIDSPDRRRSCPRCRRGGLSIRSLPQPKHDNAGALFTVVNTMHQMTSVSSDVPRMMTTGQSTTVSWVGLLRLFATTIPMPLNQ